MPPERFQPTAFERSAGLTSKWKLQAVEPDTCDPPGCRYLELWDVYADPIARTHEVVAVERVCPAHRTTTKAAYGKMRWADGNWKDAASYIEYQQRWFRWLNHQEWLAKQQQLVAYRIANPDDFIPPDLAGYGDPMPDTLRPHRDEPTTAGSVAPPAQAEIDDLARVARWNREHNLRKNMALSAMAEQIAPDAGPVIHEAATWRWEGHGDNRVLRITANGKLNTPQRARAKAAMDIQFGNDKILIE